MRRLLFYACLALLMLVLSPDPGYAEFTVDIKNKDMGYIELKDIAISA